MTLQFRNEQTKAIVPDYLEIPSEMESELAKIVSKATAKKAVEYILDIKEGMISTNINYKH